MGVQFNIKDEATVLLARKLASDSGVSVTETIRTALEREAIAREAHRTRLVSQAYALIAGMRNHWKPEFDGIELSTAHGDLLYDQNGLPA